MLPPQYLKKSIAACFFLFVFFYSPAQEVRFNNNYSVACHNCYEKKLASDFQDVFTYT